MINSFLLLLIGACTLFINTASASHEFFNNSIAERASKRPIYIIAHKVLNQKGVDDALLNGANALEMDMTAWKEGWWCDHDGKKNSWHASAHDQFTHVAQKRKKGKNIQFVIKNPNWCDLDDPKWQICSIKGLQNLARSILEPANVKVLYGFGKAGGKAYRTWNMV